ncbi:MAG TPA: DoxX family membrane protein [Solirubrobacteraceae bacterium]|nr:DoxX family membrane protein [Solirubrobacteraceae bacterium]
MRLIRLLCGPVFVFAGTMHFLIPKVYKRIVPPYLPAPEALVYLSGAAEIAGGLGLMTRSKRRLAGWWLITTLIAVFPANVHMALNPDEFPEIPGGSTALWARLPFQAVFIAWVGGAMRRRQPRQ